jgi:hypothetical protein
VENAALSFRSNIMDMGDVSVIKSLRSFDKSNELPANDPFECEYPA